MPDSNAPGYHCLLNIPRQVVLGLTSMVNLPEPDIGVLNHHILHYLIILLKSTISILFLHEVNTDSPCPFQLTNLLQICLNFLLSVGLFEVEDKSN